jgi:hypothetical protein
MLSLKSLLELWGFSSHPFEAYTAENEPRLPEYFVAPPYLDDMIGSASSMTPAVVFGARGIGKSAIRIHIENICGGKDSEQQVGGKALAITYDDFSKVADSGIESISLEGHLEAILNKSVTAALTVIASTVGDQDRPSEEIISRYFPNLDKSIFSRLVQKYFAPMTELQREKAFRGTYNYFHREALSITDRINWFQELWGSLRVPLIDIANIIQAVRGKDGITPVEAGLKILKEPLSADVLLNDLYTLSAVTEQLGFDGWYILIDKVDEDEHTDSDATKSAKLVAPLLKNLRVLEVQRIGFKFFLWNQLRPILVEERVRLDKIRNWEMEWTEAELREMINRRLMAYSDGKVQSLMDITDEHALDIYNTIIYYAMSSPREIAHILDSIFREHARHSNEDTGILISEDSVNRGLDDYCVRRIKDIYPANIVRTITKLPRVLFTSGDVQSKLRISKQAASARLAKWSDDGYIERTEDIRSENDPSKTMYQYTFREKRFERVIQRRLYNEPDTEFEDDGQGEGIHDL